MIEVLFLFGGRLGRLGYFLIGLAISIGGSCLLIFGLGPLVESGGAPVILALAVTGLAILWMSLSLQAARIRDIGLRPLFVILGFVVLYTVLHGGKMTMKNTELGTLFAWSTVALQVIFGFFLLLMPGSDEDPSDRPDPLDDRPLDRRASMMRKLGSDGSMPQVRAAAITSTRASQGTTRQSFGRRGI